MTTLKEYKQDIQTELAEFDETSLRNSMLETAGRELVTLTTSSSDGVGQLVNAIRKSTSEFVEIQVGMTAIEDAIGEVDRNVNNVMTNSRTSFDALEQVREKMVVLEKNVGLVNGLVEAVNDIADQTNLLALNATNEAAGADAAGKGFAVVANEVKQLSATTKKVNQEIHDTLTQIVASLGDLSGFVVQSAEGAKQSIDAVMTTQGCTLQIRASTTQCAKQLQKSISHLNQLDSSSYQVENGIQEMNTLGTTLSCLVEMIRMQGAFGNEQDPLERLAPAVATSDFRAPERFAAAEKEYVMQEDEVLISSTDCRGMIQFANNHFYDVSEYEYGSLEGRPHNVIRHPDMPRTAFADMWSVLKSGHVWQGYVANHSRNQRVYWVMATVFPCFENGEITGYISLRTKPDRAGIRRAIEIYRSLP